MDSENSNLLHGLLFAIAGIILVYCGEQVRGDKLNPNMCWMKASAVSSCISICSMTASFLPAGLFFRSKKDREYFEAKIKSHKESDSPENAINHVHENAIYVGSKNKEELIYNGMNWLLTITSCISFVFSVILFTVGVYLL